MKQHEPLSGLCGWPGCNQPRVRPTHSNSPFCPEHRKQRKRLMAKIRMERWRAKLGLLARERREEYARLDEVDVDPNIAMAVRLLKGQNPE